MKKILVLLVFLAALVFPWACSDNHSPSTPSGPVLANTPTGTLTVTNPTATGTLPTSTPSSTPTATGAVALTSTPTATATITWTFVTPPNYKNNYGTSAAPNGMYYDSGAGILYIAEAETKAGTIVNALEQYTNSGGGALVYDSTGNCIVVGQGTPCPIYTPVALTCNIVHFPVGVAVSSPGGPPVPGMVELLDLQNNGSATLYAENNYFYCPPALDGGPYDNFTTGFGGAAFNNPKCLTADLAGHFYVADTGNGYVDEFDGGGTTSYYYYYGSSPGWLHRWNGPGTGYPSFTFKQPVAVACDTANNVYVADAGPFVSNGVTTSVVQIYTQGGTSIIGSFYLIPGCVVNGLAVDSNGDFYVSDTSNGEVEEYQVLYNNGTPWACCNPPVPAGTVLTQVGEVSAWGDPHGPHEFYPYVPSCMQFLGGGYIVVGDTGNDLLNVFGP